MKELIRHGDKRMTVREVAEALGVSPDTILNSIKDIESQSENIRVEKIQGSHGGKPYYVLNEAQVTAVKMNLRKNSEVAAQPKTDIEKELIIQQALMYQQEKIKSLTERLALAEPKAAFFDHVADSKDALQMRDVAAALNIPDLGRNKLFELLRNKGILDNRNIPYREYQDRGYFRVVEQQGTDKEGETRVYLKTLVYQKGIEYIRRIAQGSISTFQ
jgi:phage antirepressor YoqD-like protein